MVSWKETKKNRKDENRLVERVNKNETEEGMNIDNESSHIKIPFIKK